MFGVPAYVAISRLLQIMHMFFCVQGETYRDAARLLAPFPTQTAATEEARKPSRAIREALYTSPTQTQLPSMIDQPLMLQPCWCINEGCNLHTGDNETYLTTVEVVSGCEPLAVAAIQYTGGLRVVGHALGSRGERMPGYQATISRYMFV